MSYWMIALVRRDNKSVLEITETETDDLKKLEIDPMTLQFFFRDRKSCTEEEIRKQYSVMEGGIGIKGWTDKDFPLYCYGKLTFYKKSIFVYNSKADTLFPICPDIPSIVVPEQN